MYIEPNTTIKLYSGIPLDNTYEHTLYFASLSAQNAYFHGGIAKYTLANNSYQRVERGKMRIEKKADDIYDCNYLAFQNTNYGNKWFYAFITGIEYINNITSEIMFEIDSMQSYLFDIQIKDCYVLREHSLTDGVGDNLQSEPVDIGDMICTDLWGSTHFDNYKAVLAIAFDVSSQGQNPTGGVVSGLYNGIDYIEASLNTQADIDVLNNALLAVSELNKQDSVVSLFLMPTDFVASYSNRRVPVEYYETVPKQNDFQGYVPRNNKLLTYPYNFLRVECGNDSNDYRYEWFNTSGCEFSLRGIECCDPEIALTPVEYNEKGYTGSPENDTEKLVMKDFPQVAWVQNSYATWLGTSGMQNSLKTLIAGLSFASGMVTENPMLVGGALTSLLNADVERQIAKKSPPKARNSGSASYDVAARTKNFWFKRMQVTVEIAKAIDSFFSMFGYSCNRIKKPNISSRPHWNYVQTKGCVAVGSAPSDEIKKVCDIYNKGITFWKNPSEVGTYTDAQGELINNSPV